MTIEIRDAKTGRKDTYELKPTAIGWQWLNTDGRGVLSLGGCGSARRTIKDAWEAIAHRKGIKATGLKECFACELAR